jgi:UDP-glucuronate 4-epimerase
VRSNINGFFNILECCRKHNIEKIIYASSSSIYGNADKVPFSEDANVNSPESLYAATKVCDELFANVYNKIYGLSLVGLRFFTVYGPWGRPDMAPFLFTDAIIKDKPIHVFGNGELYRDFTYIDDIVNGIMCVLNTDFSGKNEVLNIGHGSPIKLLDFITILEKELGKEATKIFCGMQKGDVYTTYADTTKLESLAGYKPKVDLIDGIHNFVEWYKGYYKL